jgi:hypothetical protein
MSFRTIALAALAGVLACLPAAAQQTKVATILAMEMGDIACYLSLRDDAGQRFRDMADFEICERKALLNQRVTLGYRQQQVQHQDCQGDPNCKKTRTVMLVVSARPLAANMPQPTTPPPAQPTTPVLMRIAGTHCNVGETVVYSCAAGAKTVSVCTGNGFLQYRFGALGQAPELSLPEGLIAPAGAATGEAVPFSGGGGAWLRFRKPPYGYVVYDGIGNWGPGGAKKTIAGVVVEQGGRKIANVKCTTKPQGELGPDWLQRVGIRTNNQDFEFPTED